MNWKKWVGLLGLMLGLLAVGPRPAQADSYQLAIASFTVYWVNVSTFQWTQVDSPQLTGRTSLSIYNMDTSTSVYCRQDTSVAVLNVNNNTTQPVNTFTLSPASLPFASQNTNPPSWITMSLSNFSSNRGAYPVSASMPVYCISARTPTGVTTSTVSVVQSF